MDICSVFLASKACSKCGNSKPLSDFSPSKLGRLGVSSQCKPCTAAYARSKRSPRQREIERNYRLRNPEHVKRLRREKERRRRSTIEGAISNRIGPLMRRALRTSKAGKSWTVLVGYSADDLRNHLEKQFHDGMSWENISDWDIDHIIPISNFDLSTPDGIRRCWALTNLRPLWRLQNMRKSNRIETLL